MLKTSIVGLLLGGALVGAGCMGEQVFEEQDTDTLEQALRSDENSACDGTMVGSIAGKQLGNMRSFRNASGAHATYSTRDGRFLDTDNPFFQDLGTNGRTCETCHTAEDGWALSTRNIQKRFEQSCGTDPLFRTVDGSNTPDADVSTIEKRREAYSLLLNKGLIRLQFPIPANAEWELASVQDPYNNDLSDGLVVYRRPLPAMNLAFNAVIMWDGREPNLVQQALGATRGHAQAAVDPDQETLQKIVDFQSSLFTTMVHVDGLGATSGDGVSGDPITLSKQEFFPNMNRDVSMFPPIILEKTLGPNVFQVFAEWMDSPNHNRAAVARGEAIFNTREFFDPVGGPDTTCSECHNAPNAGSFTGPVEPVPPFGGMRTVRIADGPLRTPDLPLYVVRNKTTGEKSETTDPGMAFQSGRWGDVGRFKAPHLRGLASRAPYFHNGSAATIEDVVDHYDRIDNIGFTAQERSDLVAFLRSL